MQTPARHEAILCAQSLRERGPLTIVIFRALGIFGQAGVLK